MNTKMYRIGVVVLMAVVLAAAGVAGARVKGGGGGGGKKAQQREQAAQAEGLQNVSIQAGGMTRNYFIHVPSGYSGNPTPLVFVFHGGGGNALGIAKTTGYAEMADRGNFIVVFPNGTGKGAGGAGGGFWNAGSGRGEGAAEKNNVDDVGFVRAMITDIKSRYSIDPRRVYAAGLSKGGMFSYYLACRASDQIAAIGVVSTTMTAKDCSPSGPVAVLHIHGTADDNVPLNGGAGSMSRDNAQYRPVSEVIDFWRGEDKCSSQKSEVTEAPDTKCYSYSSCATDVKYCLVQGGGHAWPGATKIAKWQEKNNVYVSQDFDATTETWEWFKAHPKP